MRISRDTLLGIGSVVGYFSLFLGTLGQAGFLSPVTKPHLPVFFAIMISVLPWLIVFIITFTNQSFLPPRQYRYCLLFAACWFAAVTIGAEVLHLLGYIPPDSPKFAGTMCRALMHAGWLSVLFIYPSYIDACRYESNRDT